MSKIIQIFFLLLFILFVIACSYVIPKSDFQPEVQAFIQLLIKADKPTLAEYAQYSGEGDPSELELNFELKECHSKGWEDRSKECIDYIHGRWNSADRHNALYLNWLRERFSTVGKSYRIIEVESKTEGFNHELIKLEIGKNKFLLFHNTDQNLPTGLVVGVSEVDGKKITNYLE
jgi:hypothetical protein